MGVPQSLSHSRYHNPRRPHVHGPTFTKAARFLMADRSDPLQQRAVADAIVQRAADGLRELLAALARRIDPFPPFPGALFAYGIEVEPPAASARS